MARIKALMGTAICDHSALVTPDHVQLTEVDTGLQIRVSISGALCGWPRGDLMLG